MTFAYSFSEAVKLLRSATIGAAGLMDLLCLRSHTVEGPSEAQERLLRNLFLLLPEPLHWFSDKDHLVKEKMTGNSKSIGN